METIRPRFPGIALISHSIPSRPHKYNCQTMSCFGVQKILFPYAWLRGLGEPKTSLHCLSWDWRGQGKSLAHRKGYRVGINLNIWNQQQAACFFFLCVCLSEVIPVTDPWVLQIRDSELWEGLNWTSGCLSFLLPRSLKGPHRNSPDRRATPKKEIPQPSLTHHSV